MACYCGSTKQFSACCEPLLLGTDTAQSAEQLMRSRYSAYVTVSINYLIKTTHSSTRKLHSRKSIEDWAKNTQWKKLEIIKTTQTTVEFKAFYLTQNGEEEIHHERSNFVLENGRWYYVDAF